MSKNITLKLQFLELYENGYRLCDIAKKLNKSYDLITKYKAAYAVQGRSEFLRDKVARVIDGKLKQQIVSEYLENSVSLTSLKLKYNVSIAGITKWVKQAKENGLESLTTSEYGRRKGMKSKTQTKNISPDVLKENRRLKRELESLKEEYARLQKRYEPITKDEKAFMEHLEKLKTHVAFLKKVQALVEEREANIRKNALGPSKN